MNPVDRQQIMDAVDQHRDEAVALLQQLIRFPSVNHPPTGDERPVQEFFARHLQSLGLPTELYEPGEVPSFADHPARLREHDLRGRPNVVGTWPGTGGGRSLMLVAHADVELPGAAAAWTDGDPFSGALRDGRIYGRGAGDDKSGLAVMAMVPRVLQQAGYRLAGDLILGSVADEEQAGSNGALALLGRGYRADACLLLDGCEETLNFANLGGGKCTVAWAVPGPQADVQPLLRVFDEFRRRVGEFGATRAREFAGHPVYGQPPFPERAVRVTEVRLGTDDLLRGSFVVWFYLLPGEDAAVIQRRFAEQLRAVPNAQTELHWLSRFLPGSHVAPTDPFPACLAAAYQSATGRPPRWEGGLMSDACILDNYGAHPCIGFGIGHSGRAGAYHLPDEFVTADELVRYLKTTLLVALAWCGYSRAPARP